MIKKYALVADSDVFNIFELDDSNDIAQKWINALQNNLTYVNLDNYENVEIGCRYFDNNFYLKDDKDYLKPMPQNLKKSQDVTRYAGIVDNIVVGISIISVESSSQTFYEMLCAGMNSNPLIIDISNHELKDDIAIGWTYKNNNFLLIS